MKCPALTTLSAHYVQSSSTHRICTHHGTGARSNWRCIISIRLPYGSHIHLAFPVIYSRQVLVKLFADVEVHVVVFKGAEGLDNYVVPIVGDVLVRFQQGGNFPDGNIYLCNM